MATVLADWDAGSVSAFVAKMNAAASRLGLTSTHITDPSGVDPATTSTAEDLVRLGEASLSIPVLRQIVSLAQASVPMTTVVYNPNFDLGHDGIIGIKTASDSSAQGCYLFAAQQNIGGKDVTLIGAVLGQPGGALGPNTAAVDAGDALVRSVFVALHSFTIFAPGQKVAEVDAAWGSMAPVTVAQPVDVIGWPGLVATLEVRHAPFGWSLTERGHGRDVASGSGTHFGTSGAADSECALGPRGVVASDALSRVISGAAVRRASRSKTGARRTFIAFWSEAVAILASVCFHDDSNTSTEEVHMKIHSTKRELPMLCAAAAAAGRGY